MKHNAFGILCLIAALPVVFSHSYPIALGAHVKEPLYPLLEFSFGTVGIYLFFAIGRVLLTKTLFDSRSGFHFVAYRLSWIFPSLIAYTLLCTLIIGSLLSSLGLGSYFSDVHLYKFILHDAVLGFTVFKLLYSLPYFFEHNLLPRSVNDSLWTLPWEPRAYGLLLLGGLLFGVKRDWRGSAIVLELVFLSLLFFMAGEKPALLFFAFFLGGFLYQVRDRFQYRFTTLAIVTAIALPLYQTKIFEFALPFLTVVGAGVLVLLYWLLVERAMLECKHEFAERFQSLGSNKKVLAWLN